jgi:transposase
MIRAGAGLRPFAFPEAEELVQYSVRRGLINQTEGEQVLAEVRAAGSAAARAARKAPTVKAARKPAPSKKAATRPKASIKRAPAAKAKVATRKPVKKR